MKKNIGTLGLVLVVLFSFGCSKKKVDHNQFKIYQADKKTVENPPTKEEMVLKRNDLVMLMVKQGVGVNETRVKPIDELIEKTFRIQGNFQLVGPTKVKSLLDSSEYRNFDSSNVADLLAFGKKLNSNFVGQKSVAIEKSSTSAGVDTYTAKVDLTIFTTYSGQIVMKETFSYSSNKQERAEKELKKLVQTYFPLRGFITETKGNHKVAKITLGKSVGIEAGRTFLVRNRIVQDQISGEIVTRKVNYSDSIASVKVIEVTENESWVLIEDKDQDKISIGQAVFSRPESSGYGF